MNGMRECDFLALGPHGFHRVAYTLWESTVTARTAVCAHGLTRNGRDFDFLASSLTGTHRVVCPDFPGRGRSQWLAHSADYAIPTYLTAMAALIARLDVTELDWVGTSMGGLVGMLLAAQPGSPIRRLVLNDIGPFVPRAALERIGAYVGQAPAFPDLGALETYLRQVHAPFGPLSDRQWRHLAEHSARKREDGLFSLHYDPAIAVPMAAAPAVDVDLWTLWEQVRCPVLVLRGAISDILLPETVARMVQRREETRVVEFAGVGHAPALLAPDQIKTIREWLSAGLGPGT